MYRRKYFTTRGDIKLRSRGLVGEKDVRVSKIELPKKPAGSNVACTDHPRAGELTKIK